MCGHCSRQTTWYPGTDCLDNLPEDLPNERQIVCRTPRASHRRPDCVSSAAAPPLPFVSLIPRLSSQKVERAGENSALFIFALISDNRQKWKSRIIKQEDLELNEVR